MRIKEAAEALGMSVGWMYKYVKHGAINATWRGDVLDISEDEIARVKNEGVSLEKNN